MIDIKLEEKNEKITTLEDSHVYLVKNKATGINSLFCCHGDGGMIISGLSMNPFVNYSEGAVTNHYEIISDVTDRIQIRLKPKEDK